MEYVCRRGFGRRNKPWHVLDDNRLKCGAHINNGLIIDETEFRMIPRLLCTRCKQTDVVKMRREQEKRTKVKKKKGIKPQPLDQRFWNTVKKAGPDECWEWQGCITEDGYGWFRMNRQRSVLAHRLAYELTIALLPPPGSRHLMRVRHKCENKRCCNPAHLYSSWNRKKDGIVQTTFA